MTFFYSIPTISYVFDSLSDARSFVRRHLRADDIYASRIRGLRGMSLAYIERRSYSNPNLCKRYDLF